MIHILVYFLLFTWGARWQYDGQRGSSSEKNNIIINSNHNSSNLVSSNQTHHHHKLQRPIMNILKFCTFQTRHSCVLWGWGPTVHRIPTTSVVGARCTARSQPAPRKPHCHHPPPCITLPSPHPCRHAYLQDNIHTSRQTTFTLLALLIHPIHTSSIPLCRSPRGTAGPRGRQAHSRETQTRHQ